MELQLASNNEKILRQVSLHFFYFKYEDFFLLRFKQKWCFKMGPLCSLSLMCTEYLMQRNNTNGVKLEYQIHIINLNKYFNGNTEFSLWMSLSLKNYRFQSLCIWVYQSIMFFFSILCRRIVAGGIEQYVLCSDLNIL